MCSATTTHGGVSTPHDVIAHNAVKRRDDVDKDEGNWGTGLVRYACNCSGIVGCEVHAAVPDSGALVVADVVGERGNQPATTCPVVRFARS